MAAKIHANFFHGAITGTTLTASYQTVVTATDDVLIIHVFNDTDTSIFISLDGGTTNHYKVTCQSFTIDLRSGDRHIRTPTVQVKHAGVVPTKGEVSITIIQ